MAAQEGLEPSYSRLTVVPITSYGTEQWSSLKDLNLQPPMYQIDAPPLS